MAEYCTKQDGGALFPPKQDGGTSFPPKQDGWTLFPPKQDSEMSVMTKKMAERPSHLKQDTSVHITRKQFSRGRNFQCYQTLSIS